MKVKELIEQLLEVDLELEVVCHRSVVNAVEVTYAPAFLKIETPLFVTLRTRFKEQ